MNITFLKSFIFLFLLNFGSSAFSYEVGTHGILSESALKRSLLYDLDNEQLSQWFSLSYGFSNNVGDARFFNSEGQLRNIIELLEDGAKFEDNLLPLPRPQNHFFDPLDGLGLFGTFTSSPDFILGDQLLSWGWHPWQRYSYADANKYFYRALTSEDKVLRDEYWGKTFEALGHVIHHIQDMAQPDHVRNDQHLTIAGRGDPSRYEDYTERFVDVAAVAQIPYGTPQGSLALHYQNLFSNFRSPREFWTKTGRRGMADFTNHNFVSKDTNFRMLNNQVAAGAEYPNPVPEAQTITVPVSDPSLMGSAGQALCDQLKVLVESMSLLSPPPVVNCDMDFVRTTVSDTLLNTSEVNERASSYSIFDQYLKDLGEPVSVIGSDVSFPRISVDRVFTLNRFNFDAMHKFLIPRAVAYSTGLLNYFFRGKINLVYDQSIDAWRIKNESDEVLDGMFGLYIEDMEEKRMKMNIEKLQMPIRLQPGELSEPITDFKEFEESPHWGHDYRLVFKGQLGEHAETVIGRQVFPVLRKQQFSVDDGWSLYTTAVDPRDGSVVATMVANYPYGAITRRYFLSGEYIGLASSCGLANEYSLEHPGSQRVQIANDGRIYNLPSSDPGLHLDLFLGTLYEFVPGGKFQPVIGYGQHLERPMGELADCIATGVLYDWDDYFYPFSGNLVAYYVRNDTFYLHYQDNYNNRGLNELVKFQNGTMSVLIQEFAQSAWISSFFAFSGNTLLIHDGRVLKVLNEATGEVYPITSVEYGRDGQPARLNDLWVDSVGNIFVSYSNNQVKRLYASNVPSLEDLQNGDFDLHDLKWRRISSDRFWRNPWDNKAHWRIYQPK